jgi:2-polyprenyl-3-methyl-5-hydroxy-6-metoxy-1,4-benzoquinol methylase
MEINWLELWQELILAKPHTPDSEPIKRYKNHARLKQHRPDPLLDVILKTVDCNATVLDIGTGDGRWAIPIAQKARSVTVIDPNAEILDLLRENIKSAQGHFHIIQSSWEDADVGVHDIAVCAHAMYSSPDLEMFVRKMERHARKACFLSVRLPPVDGILGELSTTIYGRRFDSANAVIAFNALYSLGIYPNVMVEKEIHNWTNDTIEEAFLRAKRHLSVEAANTYDNLIRKTLEKRLTFSGNRYIWPDGMRSALLWWEPDSAAG